MLKVSINSCRILSSIVYCVCFRRSVFGFLYLYLSYSHISSCSNDCLWGSSGCLFCMCVLYCFHSHLSLFLVMVITLFQPLLYMWDFSPIIYIVGWLVCMFVSRLLSCRYIWTSGRCRGSLICLVSLDWCWK